MLLAALLLASIPVLDDPSATAPQAAPRPIAAVVRRADGRTIRGRVQVDERGVRFEDSGLFVPAAQVVSIDEERVLLAALAAHDRRSDPVASAEYALGAGLFPEALQRLDRALRAEPADARARAMLDTWAADLKVGVPGLAELRGARDARAEERVGWIARAVAAAANTGPAAQERVAAELVALASPEEVAACVAAELRASRGTRRAFGAVLARHALDASQHRVLLAQALIDPSSEARTAAALAAAAIEPERSLAIFTAALERPHAKLSMHAAEALGFSGRAAAVAPLANALLQSGGGVSRPPRAHVFVGTQRAYVGDYDVQVALGEAIADPVVLVAQEGAVLDVAVHAVDVSPAMRTRALRTAIRRLSGNDPGSTRSAQERWWAAYQADAREPRPTPSD